MPRAKAVSDVVKPKKATVSRSPRRVSATPVKRKAPTTIPANKKASSAKSLLITLGVFLVITAGSAFVGMADTGQINVTGVIQERGQTLRDEGKDEEANRLTIPKSDGTRQPNGGLRPQTGETTPPPSPPPTPATLGAEDNNVAGTTTDDEVVSPEATGSEGEATTEVESEI